MVTPVANALTICPAAAVNESRTSCPGMVVV